MAGFRFRLESVLRHRHRLEDICQRDLAKTLRKRMILENQLRQMQTTIIESKRQLGTALTGQVELSRIAQFASYGGQVTQRAHGLVRTLAQLEDQITQARQRLVEAMRDRKAIEILRERHYQQWLRIQDRRQTVEMDDLALQAHGRRLIAEAVR